MTMHWALLGTGDIARKRVAHAIQAQADCSIAIGCRRNKASLEAFCRDFQIPRAITDWNVAVADAQLDAVYVATPVYLHAEQAIAALEHGKHVLVEKPMALTVRECTRMIDAARANARTLSVAYYRRFYPAYQRIQRAIDSGELGAVLSVFAQTGNPFPFTPDDAAYWRVDLAQGGGGPLMDIGCHRLDLFLDLLGKPQEVHVCMSSIEVPYEAENVASLVLRFGSGVHGILQCFFGTAHVPDELVVTGTRGRVRCSPLNAGSMHWEVAGKTWAEHLPNADNLHQPLLTDFVRAIRKNQVPTVTAEHAREVNAVLEHRLDTAAQDFG